MMRFWNNYPLLRILIPMLVGILWAYFFPWISLPIYAVFIAIFLLFAWMIRPMSLQQFRLRIISGILVSLLFLILGSQLVKVNQKKSYQSHYTQLDLSHLLIRINSPFIEKEKSFKTVGHVIGGYHSSDSSSTNSTGKILLYFEKSTTPTLEYGDVIFISASRLQEIQNLGNPNEFDYQAYLSRQNIYHQIYLTKTDWFLTEKSSTQLLKKISFQARGVLLDVIRSFDFEPSEFAVASAILLGYDEYLDPDLRQLYSGSGAMHILCVSGLHVGIIFMIFNLLFAPLKRIKYGEYLVSGLLIVIIWFYALVTGMSPSVFRSATMFSFITIGMALKRKNSTYNSLIASAIVLLISDPLLILHIGFQLSYMAVLAILFVQPLLSALVDSKYSLIRKIRDLISVSIAAQLGVFPIAIYYFHQFPNYFILTNLLVIPLSFMILVSGFLTISVFIIGLGSSFVGLFAKNILYYLLFSLNSSIQFISHLPIAVSKNLYFSSLDTFIVYLIILFLLCAFTMKSKRYLIISLGAFIVLMGYNIFMRYPINRQSQLIIYNIPKSSVMAIQKGRKCMIYADSSTKETKSYERYVSGSHFKSRIKYHELRSLDSIGPMEDSTISNLVVFSNKSLFIIDHRALIPSNKTHFNYVFIRNNPSISITELTKYLDFDTLIWDQSNKYWILNDWTKECDSLHLPYFDIQKKGAFIIKGS